MPEKLRNGRNIAIYLGFMEIACCIASLFFYFRRRSRIVILWIIFNFIATFLGFRAKLKLSYWGLLGHAIYTISIIGAFYIYIFIDYAMTRDTIITKKEGDTEGFSPVGIMVFTSLPFLGLFVMGIYSFVLAVWVEDEQEQRKPQEEEEKKAREVELVN
jgi:hypothetical protein